MAALKGWSSYLTEALVEMGHEVTLFASGDSVTRAKLVAACPKSLWNDADCRETLPHHVRMMNMVFEDVSRFDVVHFHTDYLHFPYMASQDTSTDATSPHVLTTSSFADERSRVLKHGDTFAVFDHRGRIKPGALGEEGLFHEGTRFLSRFQMELEGRTLIVLGSTVRDENGHLAVALTNPDLVEAGKGRLPFGTLHISVRTFLWKSVCYQQIRVKNYGPQTLESRLSLHFDADYADIFEIRGMKRKARGTDLDPEVTEDRVILGYRGRDNVVRRTRIQFSPPPMKLGDSFACFKIIL
jgi:N-terminal domain of (some) glycogen debranching enzymes/Glycosyltransferase Family 4